MAALEQQLEAHLDALIADGAGLDDIAAELERLGLVAADELQVDDNDRPVIADGSSRGYFNLRDRADGDPQRARDLAEWAIRQYRKAQQAAADANATAARHIEQIERWRKAETEKADRSSSFFEGVLERCMDDFGGGERSVKLIGGALKLRKNSTRISWDEPAALAWAMQQPNADDLAPRTLSKSAVKGELTKRDMAYYDGDGQPVEFVHDEPPAQPDSFRVELI